MVECRRRHSQSTSATRRSLRRSTTISRRISSHGRTGTTWYVHPLCGMCKTRSAHVCDAAPGPVVRLQWLLPAEVPSSYKHPPVSDITGGEELSCLRTTCMPADRTKSQYPVRLSMPHVYDIYIDNRLTRHKTLRSIYACDCVSWLCVICVLP